MHEKPEHTNGGVAIEEDKRASVPRQAMLEFIHAASSMLGPGVAGFLEDLWLDELASMEYLPSSTSDDWRLVSLAASARLAGKLIQVHLGSVCP